MKKVFIGGHPRSGTTLLGAMIGAHKSCICTPESQFKIRVLRKNNIQIGENVRLDKALNAIKRDWRFKIWGLKINSYPSHEVKTYEGLLEYLIKQYALKTGKNNPDIWVDHTPSNIKNAERLLKLFSEVKFIHLVRDGRAVAASILPLDWGANTIYKAALSWKKRLIENINVENRLNNKILKRVKFEDLVQHPEKTIRDICNFLEIDYQETMIEGTGFRTPAYTKKQHSLVGKGPTTSEISAWERLLSKRQIEIFESINSDLLTYLGYDLKYPNDVRKITLSEKICSLIYEFLKGKIVNKILYSYRIFYGVYIMNE